jgi:hypothetical protein
METLATPFGCIKLLLVLGACYLAGTGLFALRNERDGPGLAAVWWVGGACFLAFFMLLSKVIGSALIVFALLPALIFTLQLYRKPEWRITVEGRLHEPGWALALSVLCSLPVLIMGIRMGAGEYPAEFYAADSPYFLQQVYALMRTDGYPPPSLETYGFSFKYHYGFQAFVALTSMLTNLKPHLVMFSVVEPALDILTGFVIYDICRRVTGRHNAAVLCLLLVLVGSKQYLINYLDPSWWRFVTRQENFNFRYPNGPDVAGLLISLCAVRCALDFERRNMRLAAVFFTSMLPLFKIPYLVPVSAGLALVYCYELRKQFRVDLLIEILAAALFSALIYFVFSRSPVTTDGLAEFRIAGFIAMSFPWQNQTLLVLCSLLAFTAAVTRYRLSDGLLKLLLFAAAPYVLFSIWRFEIDNGHQIFDLATKVVALFTAVYLVSAWFYGERKMAGQNVIAAGIVIGLTFPGIISLAHHIYVVTAHHEQGHEYADNRAVADALGHIPVEKTLIVTNDLRYPADRYMRDNRQFQLAGIFGHRNFAADLEYGGFRREDAILYLRLVKLFQTPTWPAAQIDDLRGKAGITHLLIHKSYAHADNIPLALVYENKDYAVYRF